MEKRIFLAFSLSLLIIIFWSSWLSKTQVIEKQELIEKKSSSAPSFSLSLTPDKKTKEFWFSTGKMDLLFEEETASIKKAIFKDYLNYSFLLDKAFFLNTPLEFKKRFSSSEKIEFIAEDQNKKIIKRFLFPTPYLINLEIEMQNYSSSTLATQIPLIMSSLDISSKEYASKFYRLGIKTLQNVFYFSPKEKREFEKIKNLGLNERYFCVLIQPEKEIPGFIKPESQNKVNIGLLTEWNILPGQFLIQNYQIYLGPQDLEIIKKLNSDWTFLIHFGILSEIILTLLKFLFYFGHNWGIAIILLSILIYFLLFPLSLKQFKALKQMQALQPKIEELRKLYQDNPKKLNQELLELYKKNKINPFGGCLPILFQLPIFFSLYQTLMRSIRLKGAKFLWIKDLSEPDNFVSLPFSLPFLGNQINILPIFLLILTFLNQKFSYASASTSEQRIFSYFFPFIFVLIFYSLPSGLVLYWLINNLLMLFFQGYFYRK